jgi:hypothetical protein
MNYKKVEWDSYYDKKKILAYFNKFSFVEHNLWH